MLRRGGARCPVKRRQSRASGEEKKKKGKKKKGPCTLAQPAPTLLRCHHPWPVPVPSLSHVAIVRTGYRWQHARVRIARNFPAATKQKNNSRRGGRWVYHSSLLYKSLPPCMAPSNPLSANHTLNLQHSLKGTISTICKSLSVENTWRNKGSNEKKRKRLREYDNAAVLARIPLLRTIPYRRLAPAANAKEVTFSREPKRRSQRKKGRKERKGKDATS